MYRPLLPAGGREADKRQPEPQGKGLLQSRPQRLVSSTKVWAGSQLLTTSSWNPGWLTSARKVAAWDQLPKGETWDTWNGALMVHPRNWADGTREVIKMHGSPGTVRLPSTWSPELLGTGKGTKYRQALGKFSISDNHCAPSVFWRMFLFNNRMNSMRTDFLNLSVPVTCLGVLL